MKRSWFLSLSLAAALVAPAAWAQFGFFGWRIAEFQPDIPNGGRADTITVHPTNDSVMIVASESGGLFRTSNRGVTWTHINSLPEFSTNAVAYVPADPTIVIATTGEDFRTTNGGGIWRSTDGGGTWTQMPGPTAPAGSGRLYAYEISIASDSGTIYVGTEYGVSISTDRGATWTHTDPFAGADHRVFSVVAQSGNRVIAGGPSGIRRSDDGGATWLTSASGVGAGIWDIHALGRSPYSRDQAYVVNGNTELYFTEDGGNNWTKIAAAPAGGGGCGGITFVKAIGKVIRIPPPPGFRRQILLHFGNRCGVYRLAAPQILGTNRYNYTGAWTNLAIDHSDTRDLAFDHLGTPLLLGTDGGLHSTADGGLHWTFTGGGHNGYNALQVTEVQDQWISDINRHDLYFGTQDNDLRASGDNGTTWPNRICCEGFFIERLHRVATAADSTVNFTTCGACVNLYGGPLFSNLANWPDPPNGSNPVIVRKSWHIEGVEASTSFSKGLATTSNLGVNWRQYGTIAEDRRSIPKISDPGLLPVAYQAIRTGWYAPGNFEVNQLVRVYTRPFPTPHTVVTYPTMNNFGGLGINPTMFAWYQVYGVDPGNTMHVIAPDVVNEKMMETWDGGNNWSEIPNLTSQVTNGGTFLFRRWIFPHASAVSFSPDDPDLVAVGTWQNGLFISGDRGATWTKVPGSEGVTYITSVSWASAGDAVVSTYGRGLWRVTWGLIRPLPHFEVYCKLPCTILPFIPMGDPAERYTDAVLVFDGRIQGARMTNGVLRELFVSPGSSVVFFSDTAKTVDIKVTQSAQPREFVGVKAPKAPAKQRLVGLTLGRNGRLIGGAFSARPLSMYTPTEKELNQDKEAAGREQSPREGKPYLHLDLGGGAAGNAVAPGQPITISASNFPAAVALEVVVDDATVEKVRSDEKGIFTVRIMAPRNFGLHSIKIVDAATRQVIDGAMFLVRPLDDRRKQPSTYTRTGLVRPAAGTTRVKKSGPQ